MISAKILAKQVEKFTADNSPAILTCVGAVGAVASAYLTGKASFSAAYLIAEEQERRIRMDEKHQLEKKEYVKLVWKEYLAPAGVLTLTVGSIICANRISTRRAAAMAAAYSLSERAYSEYKEKVVEKFTPNKERQLRDEIAQEHVTKNPPTDNQVIMIGNGDVLCYDQPTGRYFRCNMEKLRTNMNNLNQQVNQEGSATLGDLYHALDLAPTPYCEELGWDTDKLLDLRFSAVLTDDNQPCISIEYDYTPIRGCNPGSKY